MGILRPNEKGWLNQYLTYRKGLILNPEQNDLRERFKEVPDVDHFWYQSLQPTGLMYGYPLHFANLPHPKANTWNEWQKARLLMAESYFSYGVFSVIAEENWEEGQLNELTEELLNDLLSYYQAVFPKVLSLRYRQKAPVVDLAELVLNRRVNLKKGWRNFWNRFFHNSLLFFDLIYFSQWQQNQQKFTLLEISQKREQMQGLILDLISAAAHADEEIHVEERELFNHFFESADLSPVRLQAARKRFKEGVSLNDLPLSADEPWIVRKYLLELALLTVFSNQEIDPREWTFLEKLAARMGLDPSELPHSRVAVKGFVLHHWQDVHFLQSRDNYLILSDRYIRDLKSLVIRNQKLVVQEIHESRELVTLLAKYTKEGLTEEESERVRRQLLDILKSVPALALLMLPGSFLTLPILFRILPKEVFLPSSFLDDKEE
ncbi:MAG: hypothetical protein AAGI38_07725 [Bacteroidota bacterium]